MLRFATLAVAAVLASSADGRASACPSADVAVSGEVGLVTSIEALLAARGIRATTADAGAGCQLLRARIERRAARYRIAIQVGGGDPLERQVGDLDTAATVIESFVRDDLAAPLHARRAPPPPTDSAPSTGPPRSARSRGVHLFAALETSVASDHTNWLGAQVGACLMLGPVCAAARLRTAYLLGGESEVWDDARRGSKELLVGVDLPIELGRVVLSPGLAAGLGATHTESEDEDEEAFTGGLRADVHLSLSMPVTRRLAIDLSTALDLTQETYAESDGALPEEPLAFLRFGAGIRFGGL